MLIMLFFLSISILFIDCTSSVSIITNAVTDIIHAGTVSNCYNGSIFQTAYWNMGSDGSQYYGYWSNINDVKTFLGLQSNGSVLVSLNIFFLKKKNPLN